MNQIPNLHMNTPFKVQWPWPSTFYDIHLLAVLQFSVRNNYHLTDNNKSLWIGEKLCDLYPLTLNAISRRIPIKLPVFLFWMTILFTRGLNRICPQIDGILLVWSTNSVGWSFAHIFLLKIKPADPVIDNFNTVFRKKEGHYIIQALLRITTERFPCTKI